MIADGYLTVEDIMDNNFSVGLLTMSGCVTALAERRPGDLWYATTAWPAVAARRDNHYKDYKNAADRHLREIPHSFNQNMLGFRTQGI